MPLSAGDRLGRYEILGPLGAGGMGEVYRARDSELERDVAIKVVPEAVSQNPDRLARFETEAKAVARLSHPNILDIHDYGREGDTTYSVTELLEGETLRERLEGGALGWRKATEIGAAIADGLGAAHEAGIVHRDLKPSNVFLTADGRVKVLDFGLARHDPDVPGKGETAVQTMTRQTDPGTVMGTVGYMSPEQVRGETVDHRSDIFSLGCVLYELVTGRQTFKGDTAVETMNAILKEEPEDISASGFALPQELAGAVGRCLEKRPQSRFQSASDLAYNLRTISSASAPMATGIAPGVREHKRPAVWIALAAVAIVTIFAAIAIWAPWRKGPQPAPELAANRVAILPLENRTGDPSLDTLGAMALDLIVQRFTETGAAEVVPMTEAPLEGALENAREKGAGLLFSGASYLDGDTLRLQARLTDVATGDLLYAFEPVTASLEAAAEGIDSLRERVVAAVATHLLFEFHLGVNTPASNYDAYQAFQQGSELFTADPQKSVAQFRNALDRDPGFHVARFYLIAILRVLRDREGAEHEFSVLEESQHPMTPLERAFIRYQRSSFERDYRAAMTASRRMLELAPQLSWPRWYVALTACALNHPREAIEALEPIVLSVVPSHYYTARMPVGRMADAQHMAGDYERELEYARLGRERFPGTARFLWSSSRALAAKGETEAVNEVIEDFLLAQMRRDTTPGEFMLRTAQELKAHGQPVESDAVAGRAVEWFEEHRSDVSYQRPARYQHALALAFAGHPKEARDLLLALAEPTEATAPIDIQANLGICAALLGDREEALRVADTLPAADEFEATNRKYWRACIAAHLGEKDRAVQLLTEAFSMGLRYGVDVHSDFGLEPLWDYPPFQELIRPKG
jgi:tetratricopeptide (TPR) repeat protein